MVNALSGRGGAQGLHSHILMTGGPSDFLGLKFRPKVIFLGL